MSTRRKRMMATVGATAVAALALSALPLTGAVAADSAPPPYVTSYLALSTGSTNTVTLVSASGTVNQTLTSGKNCAMGQGGAGLLAFDATPSTPGVGLNSGSIGVREQKNANGASCGAVDSAGDESLTLTLGPGVNGLLAGSASLDIDLKQSAQILAVATKGGSPVAGGRFELRSGTTITQPGSLTGGPADQVQTCNNPADSGPDSGTNNNCRWQISSPSWTGPEDGLVFDALTLTAVSGSFSLMGGADGTVDDADHPTPGYFGAYRSASLFELVEGAANCGDTVGLRKSAEVPASTWERLDNFTDGPCTAYPYATSTGPTATGAFARFVKPLDFETSSQAIWTTTFIMPKALIKPNVLPRVTMDLSAAEDDPRVLTQCAADWYAKDGSFVGPGTQPAATACIISYTVGKGRKALPVTFRVYVVGDAKMQW
ncbi:MAG: hypothetical protein ABI249_01330 [Ornithinibacter sp.]